MSENMIEIKEDVQAAMQRQAEKSAKFLRQDKIFAAITLSFATLVLLVLFGILVSLVVQAWPAFEEFGLSFFYSTTWSPTDGQFGAGIAVWGTLVTSLIALAVGVPISFGIAMFLTESCPVWLRYSTLMEWDRAPMTDRYQSYVSEASLMLQSAQGTVLSSSRYLVDPVFGTSKWASTFDKLAPVVSALVTGFSAEKRSAYLHKPGAL